MKEAKIVRLWDRVNDCWFVYSKDYETFKEELLKNPATRREYEALEPITPECQI